MKKAVLALMMLVFGANAWSQDSQTEYNFLRIPVSAHAAALGGENITLVDDDASLIFTNPALLSNVTAKTIGLNYMNYMSGVNSLSATYSWSPMSRGSVGVSGQLMDYGSMKETNTAGIQTGDFKAKDIALTGYFSYLLGEKFSAGIAAKFITSYIGNYNSLAVGVDLGLNFYDPESEWSVSAVARNLGGQIKAYDDEYESMPLDVQLGVSKRLTGTPLRLHGTILNLNNWDYGFKDHLALGADLILSQSIWVGCGYNFHRANQMTIGTGDDESSHGAGFSLGAGLNLDRFKLNLAWGKYHVASSSLIINVAYTL